MLVLVFISQRFKQMASLRVLSSLWWTVFSNLLFTDVLTHWRSQSHAGVSFSTPLHNPGPRLPLAAPPQLKSAMGASLFLVPKDFPFLFTLTVHSVSVGIWECVYVQLHVILSSVTAAWKGSWALGFPLYHNHIHMYNFCNQDLNHVCIHGRRK